MSTVSPKQDKKKIIYLEDTPEYQKEVEDFIKRQKEYRNRVPYEVRRKEFEERRERLSQFVTVKNPRNRTKFFPEQEWK